MTSQAASKRSPLAPGTILGDRFEIVELLGKGGYGEVYAARQLLFGRSFRTVALKLCNEGVVTAKDAWDKLNDALVVFGLLDENMVPDVAARLVQVYDMGILMTPAPRAFVSMRLIPGKKTLRSEVFRFRHAGGMPVSLSLRYMREMLLPLAWMHGLDTPAVHGDLKPENVMLTEDSGLVLVDFGMAARMPLGVRGGTLAYDASEKLYGALATSAQNSQDLTGGPESDVYSVGLIWYELLTGQHPFSQVGLEATGRGDSDAYLQAQIAAREWPICSKDKLPVNQANNRIVPASEINQDLAEQHPQVELILNKCLANNQSERFSNARVLLDSINAYVQKGGTLAKSDLEVIIGSRTTKTNETPIEIKQRTSEMWLANAAALISQGKPDQALAIADQILASAPQSVPALLTRAKALTAISGRMKEAEEACGRAMSAAPEDPEGYDTLALIRETQGKRIQAAEYRKKAADIRRKQAPGRGCQS